MIRWHVISAIMWRNLKQYFSGMLGYVIIVAFVTVCAVMTFSQQFFADNLANLDQLSRWFPFLLLFLAPAITMTAWADERRQGTDAILFTLPASDLEITLGKFFAAAAVYTVALLFSMSQLVSLAMLGTPDWGIVASTYLGYWLAGLALLSVGMFASSLTDSPTVAFVLGAVLCAVPVLVGSYFHGTVWAERFGFDWYLQDFNSGLVTFPGVLYFVALMVLMLYLNLVVIGRRHWSRGQAMGLGGHFVVRVISLAVGLVALGYVASSWATGSWAQADLTAENLYTLDSATRKTVSKVIEDKTAVNIRAFVSPEVPRDYVNPRKNLLNLLRQYDAAGKNTVNLDVVYVEPNSEQEVTAKSDGISPELVRSEIGGRVVEQEVYLGVVIKSNTDEVVLPMIDGDTSLEYELTRGIASATSGAKKLTLGIVDTDTHFGGPEFDGRRIPWAYSETLLELEKMYRVQQIPQSELVFYVASNRIPQTRDDGSVEETAGEGKPERAAPSVLLVPDPSSLDDAATAALLKYMEDGNAVILLADPLPFNWTTQNPQALGVLNAPLMERVDPSSPYGQVLSSSSAPKADGGTCSSIMQALGLVWKPGDSVWNGRNPHPAFGGKWPDYLGATWPTYYGQFDYAFVYAKNTADSQLISDHAATRGLNELLFLYPGSVQVDPSAKDLEFQPMVRLGENSGTVAWNELTMTPEIEQPRQNPRTGKIEIVATAARSQITQQDLIVLNPSPSAVADTVDHVVAAQVTGKNGRREKVIVICDLDFVADIFYDQQDALGQQLDNLRLLQNSIEVLAGDPEFVALRNRRPRARTLETVENQVDVFRQLRTTEQKVAEDQTDAELKKIQAEVDQAAAQISEDESLNFIQKIQEASQTSMNAQARFDRKQRELEKDLKIKIDRLKADERNKTVRTQNAYRWLAILLAPLPALLLGLGVVGVRTLNENQEVRQKRRTD